MKDKTTGQCKRYGFVDFERAADAVRAVEGLNQEGKVRAQMAKVIIDWKWIILKFVLQIIQVTKAKNSLVFSEIVYAFF